MPQIIVSPKKMRCGISSPEYFYFFFKIIYKKKKHINVDHCGRNYKY
jgi:hypothetical protein